MSRPTSSITSLGVGGIGLGMSFDQGYVGSSSMMTTTYHRIPAGTVEIRRASEVVSSDEHVVGHVDGFIVAPDDPITHVVMERSHLWGHREVLLAMRDVASVSSDQIGLRVTRHQIDDFPSETPRRASRLVISPVSG